MGLFFIKKFYYICSCYNPLMKKGTPAHYAAHKEKARALAKQKIAHWNARYAEAGQDFAAKLRRVAIRNQRSRWGSCSKQGNINFNYKIALLPEPLADYIIVHELCHLGEFNHSRAFWDLVAHAIPDHRERRAELRRIERAMQSVRAPFFQLPIPGVVPII
jgi:predicted metal-dependent hydrolase